MAICSASAAGRSPANVTLPEIEPAVAGSTVLAGLAAGGGGGGGAVAAASDDSASAQRTTRNNVGMKEHGDQ